MARRKKRKRSPDVTESPDLTELANESMPPDQGGREQPGKSKQPAADPADFQLTKLARGFCRSSMKSRIAC